MMIGDSSRWQQGVKGTTEIVKVLNFVIIDVREGEVADDETIEGGVNIPLGQLIRNARQGAMDNLKGIDCHILQRRI